MKLKPKDMKFATQTGSIQLNNTNEESDAPSKEESSNRNENRNHRMISQLSRKTDRKSISLETKNAKIVKTLAGQKFKNTDLID